MQSKQKKAQSTNAAVGMASYPTAKVPLGYSSGPKKSSGIRGKQPSASEIKQAPYEGALYLPKSSAQTVAANDPSSAFGPSPS
mgnify:CR=1 FL=1